MFSLKPFKSILELIKAFPTEQACIEHLEWIIWDGNVVSPFDSDSKVYKCKNGKYKCTSTNKYFNVKTNTIFENTKIPLQQWFLAIYLFTVHKKGISSYQLAEELNITQKSAWFMLSRIRYAMDHENFVKEMEGTIQIDETFVGGKNKNRHADKKVKNSQGRSFKDKTPVLGMIDESGKVKCSVIENTQGKIIQPIILDTIKKGSVLFTDEWHAYKGLDKYYIHKYVDHGKKEYVNGEVTTNKIENFWSQFKRGIIGLYHQVSKKHLQKYADEFSFRHNHKDLPINDRFNIFLGATNNKRLTYSMLING
ncbi:MAG: IS1595 family transposase [Sphingobacteriales bacterium]|nr:MAG: IS1595 family transposase [Sphingobacteriales bacterium]